MTLLSIPEPPGWARSPELRASSHETSPVAAPSRPLRPPNPLDWKPKPRFRQRALEAIGTPRVVGIAVFLAAAMTVGLLIVARPHVPEPSVTGESEADWSSLPEVAQSGREGELAAGDAEGRASAPAVAGEGAIIIHVVGEIQNPGIVELRAGDRVVDAIDAAGGVTKDAVLDGLNLARPLSDGEQIVVPDAAEARAAKADPASASGGRASPMNLNSADAAAFEALPRVGPALAQRIVDWREAHGGFTQVDQLLQVAGIGAKTLEGFRDLVTV